MPFPGVGAWLDLEIHAVDTAHAAAGLPTKIEPSSPALAKICRAGACNA